MTEKDKRVDVSSEGERRRVDVSGAAVGVFVTEKDEELLSFFSLFYECF